MKEWLQKVKNFNSILKKSIVSGSLNSTYSANVNFNTNVMYSGIPSLPVSGQSHKWKAIKPFIGDAVKWSIMSQTLSKISSRFAIFSSELKLNLFKYLVQLCH